MGLGTKVVPELVFNTWARACCRARKLIAERAALNAALNAGGCDSSGGFCRVLTSVHAWGPSRKGLVAPDGAALKFGRPG